MTAQQQYILSEWTGVCWTEHAETLDKGVPWPKNQAKFCTGSASVLNLPVIELSGDSMLKKDTV
jgi:hypothetical protein